MQIATLHHKYNILYSIKFFIPNKLTPSRLNNFNWLFYSLFWVELKLSVGVTGLNSQGHLHQKHVQSLLESWVVLLHPVVCQVVGRVHGDETYPDWSIQAIQDLPLVDWSIVTTQGQHLVDWWTAAILEFCYPHKVYLVLAQHQPSLDLDKIKHFILMVWQTTR